MLLANPKFIHDENLISTVLESFGKFQAVRYMLTFIFKNIACYIFEIRNNKSSDYINLELKKILDDGI